MKRSPKSNPKPKAKWQFEAIGTAWEIETPQPMPAVPTNMIEQVIERFDKTYSRFRPDSMVASMARKAGEYRLPENAKPLIELYRHLYDATSGAMTPLIGGTLEQAGYDANYTLHPAKLTPPLGWDEVIAYHYPFLRVIQPALLDFGAAGKGYLADLVSETMRTQGIESHTVDAGGDIVQRGIEAIRVGLEHPVDPSRVIGIATINNQSICGSAGNRRAWKGYNHIIDPRSLKSPTDIAATWVVAASGLVADGLATALYFSDAKTLMSRYTFEYAILYSNNSLSFSSGFPAEFY